MGEIRNLVNQIRDIQRERKDADYYDSDWDDQLADLAIRLADAVEPKLGPDPREVERKRRMAEIDREVRASWRRR